MAETNSKGERLISVVRMIEYHGTEEWIKATLAASRIAILGKTTQVAGGSKLPEGCYILSGQVLWDEMNELPDTEPGRTTIPIPPGSNTPV